MDTKLFIICDLRKRYLSIYYFQVTVLSEIQLTKCHFLLNYQNLSPLIKFLFGTHKRKCSTFCQKTAPDIFIYFNTLF